MQALEHAADAAGHTFAAMMEEAGASVARTILQRHAPLIPRPLILAGPGNNGGDGLVCARHLHEAGARPRVYLWKRDPAQEADEHLALLQKARVEITCLEDDAAHTQLGAWLEEADVLVDALLGTGGNRPIAGDLATLLDFCRAAIDSLAHLRVCAVDCPSGLNCDTGEIDSHALPADFTITFAAAKWGHYRFPGAAHCGEVLVADIGIDPGLYPPAAAFVLSAGMVAPLLPVRANVSHKGSFGKVIGAVGSMPFAGAAVLSLGAAARVGAGLVTGAVTDATWLVVAPQLREATWKILPTDEEFGNGQGVAGSDAAYDLADVVPDYDAMVLGCGMTQTEGAIAFVEVLLDNANLPPLLIDADGLNCLTYIRGWPGKLPDPCILTPHPAEFARLLEMALDEVLPRRWELALEAAANWQAIVLVKGPYTVIAHPDGRLAVLPVATPALATAGTGDVLAGAITGLMAQGVDAFEAACLGAWLHGAAGRLCEEEIGRAGVVAGDVLMRLPAALQRLSAYAPWPRA
jgi:NAD(P)H-hydrate epimerase